MKKIISMLLAIILCFAMPLTSLATGSSEAYVFIKSNGERVTYYLDDNQMPYIEVDGENIPIALPLEHLRVTDEKMIEELNSSLGSSPAVRSNAPTNPFYLSATSPSSNSIKYTQVMSFLSVTELWTRYLEFYPNHEALCVKTADAYKEHWYSSVKIDFSWFYYTEYLDEWYEYEFENVDCTGTLGKRFQHEPSINPYGRFKMKKGSSGVTSFNLEIWSTYAW